MAKEEKSCDCRHQDHQIKSELVVKQYECLREEIIVAKQNLSRFMYLGVVGIPFFLAAAELFREKDGSIFASLALLVSPIVPLAFLFFLVYEQSVAMRVGKYIREEVESRFNPDEPKESGSVFMFWEQWLQAQNKENARDNLNFFRPLSFFRAQTNRTPELFLFFSTALAFLLYYLAAVILACIASYEVLDRVIGPSSPEPSGPGDTNIQNLTSSSLFLEVIGSIVVSIIVLIYIFLGALSLSIGRNLYNEITKSVN